MKKTTIMAVILCVVAAAGGCVEESSAEPNSDEGHLFVELEDPLAVDWSSEVLVKGSTTGQEHCDKQRGCYLDHQPVDMQEVTSTNPEVVEVVGFEADSYGETDAIRLDLEVIGEGEATLEFEFTAEGIDTVQPADEQGDSSTLVTDSFSVEAREVSSLRLQRIVDDVDPGGPYGMCTVSGGGTYLMQQLDEMFVQLTFAKLDAAGNQLRGSGKFPVDVEPEGAIEVEETDEARHRVTIRPTQFGSVNLVPENSGTSLQAHFLDVSDVTEMEVTLFQLDAQGMRAGSSSTMWVDYLYELESMPALPADAPLCGGRVFTSVHSLTPAICDQVGTMESTGNPALIAEYGGQCRIRVTMEDINNQSLIVEDHRFDVQYSY